MNKNIFIKFVCIISSTLLITLDQITKFLAKTILSKYITIPIIPSVLHFTYVENRGAAFGILQNQKIFLVWLTLIFLIALIFFIWSKKVNNTIQILSLSLIISGGIGNFIDRAFKEVVIDYIDFRLINFAVFNLADAYICIGTVLMIVYILFYEKKEVCNETSIYTKL